MKLNATDAALKTKAQRRSLRVRASTAMHLTCELLSEVDYMTHQEAARILHRRMLRGCRCEDD